MSTLLEMLKQIIGPPTPVKPGGGTLRAKRREKEARAKRGPLPEPTVTRQQIRQENRRMSKITAAENRERQRRDRLQRTKERQKRAISAPEFYPFGLAALMQNGWPGHFRRRQRDTGGKLRRVR